MQDSQFGIRTGFLHDTFSVVFYFGRMLSFFVRAQCNINVYTVKYILRPH